MIPNSAIPDAINALAQKAQATGDDTASKSLAKTVSEISSDAPAPEANESSVPELSADHAQALQDLGYTPDQISKFNLRQTRAIVAHSLPARGPALVPRPAIPADSPFYDAARPVLEAAPISQSDKETLWDYFHQSVNADDLANRIAPILAVPNDIKNRLWELKAQAVTPVAGSPVDKVVQAVQKMATMDPKVLATVENHPRLFSVLTSVKE